MKRAGLLVAVISNTEDGRLADSLAAAGLGGLFDLLVDSHLVGCRKPDAAIFRLALERLGVEAGEAASSATLTRTTRSRRARSGMRAVLLDPLDMHPEASARAYESLGDLLRARFENRIRSPSLPLLHP